MSNIELELLSLKRKLEYDSESGEFRWLTTEFKHVAGNVAGRKSVNGYVVIYVNFKYYYAHKLAIWFETGVYPSFVDHVNQIPSDNRISNLRVCTQSQNCFNQGLKRSNTSGHKNVSYCKSWNKYTVQIKVNRVKHYIGGFDTLDEAVLAADKARLEYAGEFARSS